MILSQLCVVPVTQPLMGVLGPHTPLYLAVPPLPMGDAPGGDGGLGMDLDLLISSSPACSTHKKLIPGQAELAAYLGGAVPGGGRDVGTVPHLAGQASLQKYLLEKVQLHPEENRVREQSPMQVCSRVSRGMTASGCREPSTAQHPQPAPPGSAGGAGQGCV